MTLEYRDTSYGKVMTRLVECPFCGQDLRGKEFPPHIRKCSEVPR